MALEAEARCGGNFTSGLESLGFRGRPGIWKGGGYVEVGKGKRWK